MLRYKGWIGFKEAEKMRQKNGVDNNNDVKHPRIDESESDAVTIHEYSGKLLSCLLSLWQMISHF